ncbi:MAG: hypothetical protein IT342_05590 [Candidatus Melainabacteria bacterium]|nr:hypothetical protein [Candidatus Melainabacteria bacterium]
MNKRNPGVPALPSGLVKVDKGSMRDVIVGIINGDRMPAGGFDVNGLPPNHFRVVEPGFWGLIIGAKHALDVRVIQDGKLLIEKRINPIKPPSNPFMDAKVRQMMAESPQPHFVTEDAQGKQFEFKGHDSSLSAAEVVHEQFHPLRNAVPPTIDMIDSGGPKTDELIADITPDQVVAMLMKQQGVNPADLENAATEIPTAPVAAATDLLASTADGDQPALPFADAPADATLDTPASELKCEAVDKSSYPPALDLTSRNLYWAPSNGLIAVGIRMVQNLEENEPPAPPDAFTYVLFQMNPWDVHTVAMAHAANRVILPSREAMARMMADEGFDGDVPLLPKVRCACAKIGCNSGH